MKNNIYRYLNYLPIAGLILFCFFYAYAAFIFPGGSYTKPNAQQYSFFHNLICDTMDVITINGTPNNARSVAVISHVILSISVGLFYLILPKIFTTKSFATKFISIGGMITMTVFAFMFTDFHDEIVVLTAVLGSITMVPFFFKLNELKQVNYRMFAYFGFSLSILVFVMFILNMGLFYLPFIQKIAFISDAIWVIWTCLIVSKNTKQIVVLEKSVV
jgi:hypothetical protein